VNEPDFVGDLSSITGPDRDLECGCQVINGVICFVFKGDLDTKTLHVRPGRIIAIDGPNDERT